MRTKGVASLLVTVLLLGALLASASTAAAQKKAVIRVGVNLDITGYAAWLVSQNSGPFSSMRNRSMPQAASMATRWS